METYRCGTIVSPLSSILRKALLSERDGNMYATLPSLFIIDLILGRHYSLKEMETAYTNTSFYVYIYLCLGRHYSLKEMETVGHTSVVCEK